MPRLAEIQFELRQALVEANPSFAITKLLSFGVTSVAGLNVHRRHYETSLTKALMEKFPATGWLLGTGPVSEAAARFTREHPPQRPCIAEFGAEFPAFLAQSPFTAHLPYVRDFAELEWRVGHASIAANRRPLTPHELAAAAKDRALDDAALTLQPGLHYLKAAWPVDDLMTLYLTDAAPEQLVFDPLPVWLEIGGSRGEFSTRRLEAPQYAFRAALERGDPIGDAAAEATGFDPAFDPVAALIAMAIQELIVAVLPDGEEESE